MILLHACLHVCDRYVCFRHVLLCVCCALYLCLHVLMCIVFRMSKLLESFKSVDFDVDFFVSESRGVHVMDQLDACASAIDRDLRVLVRECNDLVIGTASLADTVTSDLLVLREQMGPVRQSIETAYKEESARITRMKAKHAQLALCLEANRIVKKIIKLKTDARPELWDEYAELQGILLCENEMKLISRK